MAWRKARYRSRPLAWAAPSALAGDGGVVVSQNRTNRARVSAAIARLRSRRSDWRERRSRRRAKAASSRSAESGERNEATADSMTTDLVSFWRVATFSSCSRRLNSRYTLMRRFTIRPQSPRPSAGSIAAWRAIVAMPWRSVSLVTKVSGRHHDSQCRLDRPAGVREEVGNARESFIRFGIEHVQDCADE